MGWSSTGSGRPDTTGARYSWRDQRVLTRRTATSAPTEEAQNVNELYQRELTGADRVAIAVAEAVGSWKFIVGQSAFLAAWVTLNVVGWMRAWDPYPFILLNLVLNVLAGYTAPLILMAQNRDAERDRLMMQEDFETDRRAAEEIRKIVTILEQQGQLLVMLLEQRDRHDQFQT